MAQLFPMMTDDELHDLAEDIKENGLLHPIVLDGDGVLIDGRNRLRACEIAGVEPTYQSLNGHDARAFIVSANLARRNLTKGQQAMALAMIYPEAEKGGRGRKSAANSLVSSGFSRQRLDQARSVLHHSRALAEELSGQMCAVFVHLAVEPAGVAFAALANVDEVLLSGDHQVAHVECFLQRPCRRLSTEGRAALFDQLAHAVVVGQS
jgi:hypothetical protein